VRSETVGTETEAYRKGHLARNLTNRAIQVMMTIQILTEIHAPEEVQETQVVVGMVTDAAMMARPQTIRAAKERKVVVLVRTEKVVNARKETKGTTSHQNQGAGVEPEGLNNADIK